MDGQPPAVHIVGLIAQQLCELGLQNGNDKVKGRIGVAHNEEQRRFLISDSIKLHFVIRHQVTQKAMFYLQQQESEDNETE